jgi:hypothetical protein
MILVLCVVHVRLLSVLHHSSGDDVCSKVSSMIFFSLK